MKRYCIIQRLVLLRGCKFILVLIDQFHRNAQEEFGKILYWLKQDFYRPQMEVDIRNLLGNVMFVRKRRCWQYLQQDYCFPYLFLERYRVIYQRILLRSWRNPMGNQSFSRWLTDLPIMHIFYLLLIPTQQCKWLEHSLAMSLSCRVCPKHLFVIGNLCSEANFGKKFTF